MADDPRIAVFDDWIVFKAPNRPTHDVDDPNAWASQLDAPQIRSTWIESLARTEHVIVDPRVHAELGRVLTFQTCAICRGPMVMRDTWVDGDEVYVCLRCGYWAGFGSREWGMHHTFPARGAIGRYRRLLGLDAASADDLVTHLRRFPRDMAKLSPTRAETFVVDLIADVLQCEVRAVGGPGDGGVDGFIVKGDEISSIIQVKWRVDMDKAESVSTVREVGGTLLARGIPHGILVSNRTRFSGPATEEARTISTRSIRGLGRLDLELVDYHRVVDMLDIATRRLTEGMGPDDWFPARAHEDICVFDGAAGLTDEWVERQRGWSQPGGGQASPSS